MLLFYLFTEFMKFFSGLYNRLFFQRLRFTQSIFSFFFRRCNKLCSFFFSRTDPCFSNTSAE